MKNIRHVLLCLLLVSCTNPYKYEIGDCYWHFGSEESPKAFRDRFYKIVGMATIEKKYHYILQDLNVKYYMDVDIYRLTTKDYTDRFHPSNTHEEKCEGYTKKVASECKQDKNYKFHQKKIKCPTQESFNNWLKTGTLEP